MAKAREIQYHNNRYQGSLTEEDCKKLDAIIELDEENGAFEDLRHIIYDLPESVVFNIIDEVESCGKTLTEYEKSEGTLRDEQTLGTAFMFFANNCILGDSVGMGKTPQIAGLCRILENMYKESRKPFRYLLLTEKNLVGQTRKKMIQFTGSFAYSLNGDAISTQKFLNKLEGFLEYSVVGSHTLVSQPLFIKWLEETRKLHKKFPFDLLVIDESSILGNSVSGVYKDTKILASYFSRVILLNATPFNTKLNTFYNQLNLIDHKLLPAKTNFEKEYVLYNYTGMYPKPTGKYKNPQRFRHLVGYRYFARTRESKGGVMENCSGRVVISPLSKLQKELEKTTQMYQMVYDCPNYFDSDIAYSEENVPKLASLKCVLEDEFYDADTVLIFVHYREAQDSLSRWLTYNGHSNRVLCGETKNEERESIIEGFKNTEYRVLITNVQKGLDFGECDHCIFYGFDPNPSKMVQFEGRITRSFDIRNKRIILLVSQGKELQRLNKIIKDRAQATAQFTKSDLSCIMDILLER